MLDALLRILELVRKELLAILKDPRSRIALIGPPILQCLIFGYAATYDLNHVPYAALDQEATVRGVDRLCVAGRRVHALPEAEGCLIKEKWVAVQTIFLAGDIWSVIVPNAAVLAAMATGLLVLSRMATKKRLA